MTTTRPWVKPQQLDGGSSWSSNEFLKAIWHGINLIFVDDNFSYMLDQGTLLGKSNWYHHGDKILDCKTSSMALKCRLLAALANVFSKSETTEDNWKNYYFAMLNKSNCWYLERQWSILTLTFLDPLYLSISSHITVLKCKQH